MKIITPSRIVTVTKYDLCFDWDPDRPYCGFAFPCDANGKVNTAKLTACAKDSLAQCLNGSVDGKPISKGYVNSYTRCNREAAVGRCECGNEVHLGGFTNTCRDCGADYNSAGQRLADRSQWGEETGESLSDILRIP